MGKDIVLFSFFCFQYLPCNMKKYTAYVDKQVTRWISSNLQYFVELKCMNDGFTLTHTLSSFVGLLEQLFV